MEGDRRWPIQMLLAHFVAPAHAVYPLIQKLHLRQEVYEIASKKAAGEQLTMATQRIPAEMRRRTTVAMGMLLNKFLRLANTEVADLTLIATHRLTGWGGILFSIPLRSRHETKAAEMVRAGTEDGRT